MINEKDYESPSLPSKSYEQVYRDRTCYSKVVGIRPPCNWVQVKAVPLAVIQPQVEMEGKGMDGQRGIEGKGTDGQSRNGQEGNRNVESKLSVLHVFTAAVVEMLENQGTHTNAATAMPTMERT